MNRGAAAHHRDQRRALGGVEVGEVQRVAGAQQRVGDQGRAGVGHRAVGGPHRGQRVHIGVIRREPACDARAQDAGRRLAGLDRLGGVKAVEPAPRVGFDVAERLWLVRQPPEHPGQKRVLPDVGQVPGMIGVLVGKHGAPPMSRALTGPGMTRHFGSIISVRSSSPSGGLRVLACSRPCRSRPHRSRPVPEAVGPGPCAPFRGRGSAA